MGEPARKRPTYADLLAVPSHLVAEPINGVLHTMPRPRAVQARASSQLGGMLFDPFNRARAEPFDSVELSLTELWAR